MKKLIAILLSVLMVFSASVVPASAVQEHDIYGTEQTQDNRYDEYDRNEDDSFPALANHIGDFIYNLINLIHNFIGTMFAIFGKVCPLCGKMHGLEDPTDPDPGVIKSGIEIDRHDFAYDRETKQCHIYVKPDAIKGTASDADKIETFRFKVFDKNGNLVDTGLIEPAANWSTDLVDFIVGENELLVTAVYENGKKASDSETILYHIKDDETPPAGGDEDNPGIIIDTTTDTDGDGLVDYLEINYTNTEIDNPDTDGDGLTDYEEVYILKSDPLKKDSDGNGTNDADEDFDGDGISNIDELRAGTDPMYEDSDFDLLSDYDEINRYKTDPLNKDTDKDGVDDGNEVRCGTDPLKAETIFSDNASSGIPTVLNPVALDVKAQLTPDQVGTLKVIPSDNRYLTPVIPGYLSNAFEIIVDGKTIKATLTFTYDLSLGTIGSGFMPTIYYFNEETKGLEEVSDQKAENGKVTAEIDKLSTYILLNKVSFDKVWDEEIAPPLNEGETTGNNALDMVFVIDDSGSMSVNDYNDIRLDITEKFISKLRPIDKYAIVRFTEYSDILLNLTGDKTKLDSAFSSFESSGGTNGSDGLYDSLNIMDTSAAANKFVIFLTDGDDGYHSYSYSDLAERAKQNNVKIYSIGLGDDVNTSNLKLIANKTDGKYYHASVSDQLNNVIDDIMKTTIDLTKDKNKDKIPDYFNDLIAQGKLRLTNGSNELSGIDFNFDKNGNPSADYDGDGIINGEELVITVLPGNRVSVEMKSDPTQKNSDSDSFDDGEEYANGSDPLVPSYKADIMDLLYGDINFTHENILKDKYKWKFDPSQDVWSTIVFGKSNKDEAARLLISFLKSYVNTEDIDRIAESIIKEQAVKVALNLINALEEEGGNAAKLIPGIKNLANSINDADKLSPDFFDDLQNALGSYAYIGDSLVTALYTKAGSNCGFTADGTGFECTGLDIYDSCRTYAYLCANSQMYMNVLSLLDHIKENDLSKERFMAKAADTVAKYIIPGYDSFLADLCRDAAAADAAELTVILNGLTSDSPYAKTINKAADDFSKICSITEIADVTYALFLVGIIKDACKDMFNYGSAEKGFYNTDSFTTYSLSFLIYIRTEGNSYAKELTGRIHYRVIFESDAEREAFAENIADENSILESCRNHLYVNF